MYVVLTRRTVKELRDARLAELEPILLVTFGLNVPDGSKDWMLVYPSLDNVGRGSAIGLQFRGLISTSHRSPPDLELELDGFVGEHFTLLPGESAELASYDDSLETVGRYFWLALRYEDAQRNCYHRELCYALAGGYRLMTDTLYRTTAHDRPPFVYDQPLFPASGSEQVFSVRLRSPEEDLRGQISAERKYAHGEYDDAQE